MTGCADADRDIKPKKRAFKEVGLFDHPTGRGLLEIAAEWEEIRTWHTGSKIRLKNLHLENEAIEVLIQSKTLSQDGSYATLIRTGHRCLLWRQQISWSAGVMNIEKNELFAVGKSSSLPFSLERLSQTVGGMGRAILMIRPRNSLLLVSLISGDLKELSFELLHEGKVQEITSS